MLKFIKFILAIGSLFLLLFLVQISFFSGKNNEKYNFDFLLKSSETNDNILTWTLNWEKNINFSEINFFDNIYFSNKDSFNVKQEKDKVNITLWKWIFILDLNDLTKQYTINSDGFIINLNSIWNFFIDTTKTKINVLSINSSLQIDLLDKEKNKLNSYFIYPHEYINFPVYSNLINKNTDILRMKQLFLPNGYYSQSFKDILDQENIYAIKKLSIIIWKTNLDFFNIYLKNKYLELEKNNLLYDKISKLENVSFPFKEIIEKYSNYFVNDSKKIIYLQNNIYNKVIEIFNKKLLDKNLIQEINSDLDSLKLLSLNNYNQSIKVIDNVYKILLFKNNIINDKQIENFVFIKNTWLNFKKLNNYILLKNIYFNYDLIDNKNSHLYFNNFLSSYLINSSIVENNNNLYLNNKQKLSEIEAFVFFLEEYINSTLFVTELENLAFDIDILSQYIWLNKMIYFSDISNSIKIRTGLNQNKILLVKLEWYLRSNFFEKNRNEDKLLVLKEQSFDLNLLLKFEIEFNKIYTLFIENNQILIDEGNSDLIKEYKNLFAIFEEEVLALKDYNKYKLAYDDIAKELYWTLSVGEKDLKNYSTSSINNYLSRFNWISYNQNEIKKIDNYFKIKNVYINWEKYDFHLYPSFWNKLDIFKSWEIKLLFSYDLDYFQILLEEKYKWANIEDKYKYDFSNFLNERFKIINNNIINSVEDKCSFYWQISDWKWWCVDIIQDNAFITVFKRDKLIWEEFNTIKNFLELKYENLEVKKINNKYNIKIKNAKASIDIQNNNNNFNYLIDLSSNYDFENHLFYDIKIKLKDKNNIDNYLFDWWLIYFSYKKVKITELKKFLEEYLYNIDNLKSIYSILFWKINLNNVSIEELWLNSYLKFENNWKNITIKFKGTTILSIIKDWTSILKKSIKTSELEKYIDKLK